MTKAKAQAQDAGTVKNAMVHAALDLAGHRPWVDISYADIAAKAGYAVGDVLPVLTDKTDVVCAMMRDLDRLMAASAGTPPARDNRTLDESRDMLFDVMMERFDLMADAKQGYLSIMKACPADPAQMALTLPWAGRSAAAMLEVAGIPAHGWSGAARIIGLSGVYLYVLRVWAGDESPDMAATMAALDKALSRLFAVAARFDRAQA